MSPRTDRRRQRNQTGDPSSSVSCGPFSSAATCTRVSSASAARTPTTRCLWLLLQAALYLPLLPPETRLTGSHSRGRRGLLARRAFGKSCVAPVPALGNLRGVGLHLLARGQAIIAHRLARRRRSCGHTEHPERSLVLAPQVTSAGIGWHEARTVTTCASAKAKRHFA